MKLLNTFLRLSPSIIRLGLISYLFASKNDTILYEFSLLSGLVLGCVIFVSLDLYHKLMLLVPTVKSKRFKGIINTRYLELQLILGIIGVFIFYFFVIWSNINLNIYLISIFYLGEHLIIELGRILRLNEKIITASFLDFIRTIIFAILLLIGSLYELTTGYLIFAYSLSIFMCLFFLRKKIKKDLLLHFNIITIHFNLTRVLNMFRKLIDIKMLFVLVGTVFLRYMQVFDKKLINDYIDTETAARWSVFLGLSMFVYRFIDSFSLQFLTPKLIRINSENKKSNFFKIEIIKVFSLTILLLFITYFLGLIYIQVLRPEVLKYYKFEMPYVLFTVFSYILYLTATINVYSRGKLFIYSLFKILTLVLFLLIVNYALSSYSIKLFALIIGGIYMFLGIVLYTYNFIIKINEKSFIRRNPL
jgi:hypothetical protein